ncbi:MAG: polysaccharide biosynthesis protein [Chloroflexota bacterium]|nr:MAG: polysaccharide biosynthesis protein [Chloroflexota bacterium]
MQDHSRRLPVAPEQIDLRELVGRAPLAFDISYLKKHLTGRRILVTGAGGSIGENLSEMLLSFEPSSLILVDHHELSLFQLVRRLSSRSCPTSVEALLADVRDRGKLARMFQEHHPEVVFHLAAYKHVHIGEANSDEVFTANVLGTVNMVEESVRAGVQRFVYVSTDKAVDPVSVYGGTKRIVELLVAAIKQERTATTFSIVRLVNTVGASGGVIRVFAEQIGQRQPITVTHPEMTRYWISMDEAIKFLSLAACVDEVPGLLVLNMGEPVRLMDVADKMWELVGDPEHPLKITYVGLRPGERLHERVAGDTETVTATPHPGVLEVRGSALAPIGLSDLLARIAEISEQASRGDLTELRRRIAALAAL